LKSVIQSIEGHYTAKERKAEAGRQNGRGTKKERELELGYSNHCSI